MNQFKREVIQFVKLTDNAFVPTKGSEYSAGYDLKSAYNYEISAKSRILVKTDLSIKLPHETYGRIAPRSGLSLNHCIDIGGGVIDEDYRGNIGIVVINNSNKSFEIKKGDRIAQLICEKIKYLDFLEVDMIDDTLRGSGGFGSTGI
jgi:dUTP pyrophosphatase